MLASLLFRTDRTVCRFHNLFPDSSTFPLNTWNLVPLLLNVGWPYSLFLKNRMWRQRDSERLPKGKSKGTEAPPWSPGSLDLEVKPPGLMGTLLCGETHRENWGLQGPQEMHHHRRGLEPNISTSVQEETLILNPNPSTQFEKTSFCCGLQSVDLRVICYLARRSNLKCFFRTLLKAIHHLLSFP